MGTFGCCTVAHNGPVNFYVNLGVKTIAVSLSASKRVLLFLCTKKILWLLILSFDLCCPMAGVCPFL